MYGRSYGRRKRMHGEMMLEGFQCVAMSSTNPKAEEKKAQKGKAANPHMLVREERTLLFERVLHGLEVAIVFVQPQLSDRLICLPPNRSRLHPTSKPSITDPNERCCLSKRTCNVVTSCKEESGW
jgi:hypothetical protein